MELWSNYVISFFIYAFIGYICEVIYCGIPAKKFINRGFLHGPYLPIYGFGGLAIKLLVDYLPKSGNSTSPFLVFFAGMLSASIIEYIGSFFLERVFSIKLWDYSKKKINLNGRICLLNSSLFGGLSLFAVYVLAPWFLKLKSNSAFSLSKDIKILIAEIIVIVMGSDFVSSIISMKEFRRNLRKVRTLVIEMPERLKVATDVKSRQLLKDRLNAEIDDIRMEISNRSNRIVKAFPSMTSKIEDSRVQLDLLKMNFEDLRARGNKIRKERIQALKDKVSKN